MHFEKLIDSATLLVNLVGVSWGFRDFWLGSILN